MSHKTITIRCKNNGRRFQAPLGSTLQEVYELSGLTMEFGPVGANINNKSQGLNYQFYNSKDVEFLDLHTAGGQRIYTRTLFFVLVKAAEDLFPGGRLFIGAPIDKGHFCELHIGRPLTDTDAQALRSRMREIVAADMPIHRIQCPIEEAIELFRSRGMESKAQLLETLGDLYTYYYKLDETIDYFYSSLLTHTGQLHQFDLVRLADGLLLRVPGTKDPAVLEPWCLRSKMLDVFREHNSWQRIMGVSNAGELNAAIRAGRATEIINVAETLQERKLSRIADEIVARNAKLVLIAGPSSSGKTTTSKRIAMQMMACGLHPHTISIDDYLVNRVETPKDENGEYDFECIGSVDTALFNEQICALLKGETVELPRYDFPTGRRVYEGNYLSIGPDDVIILEGNHALNPLMSEQIPEEKKYRIFVSTLTTIALDDHNHVPTTDIRLLRRILRDYKYRGFSATDTIRRCPSVTRGEEIWICPYQDEADATFNAALIYEFNVIRNQVMPILEQVNEREPEYSEASRLRKFLNYFVPVPGDQVPPTSLLREFAGGSSFTY
ncbi:MAG: nucleoside kinase [Bacteroidaceae bacterium]|nr:nucleoside kinase [Bacteroidaceae bacterium]